MQGIFLCNWAKWYWELDLNEVLDHGSFSATGQNVTFDLGFGLPGGGETGSFALTGQAFSPALDVSAILDQGSFAVTGQAASGLVGEIFETGGFNLTGQISDIKKQCD